ncbi:MAG: phage/plasmid primase, P4 family, partial [bacterium]
VITIKEGGTLGFKCHHDGCKGYNWRALRAKFEPTRKANCAKMGAMAEMLEDEALIAEYGQPIMRNSKGEPTDINQMFTAAKFARDNFILYESGLNLFYFYDPDTGLWKTKTESKLVIEIGMTLRNILNDYGADVVLKKRTENLVKQILGFLKGVTEKTDAFKRTIPIIHVANGVLHLGEDLHTLHTFAPEYYSRNRSETCFDPKAECPRFLNELLRPALSEEDILLLQLYAGQCLMGRNPSQKILLLRGTPGGGKSTLVAIIEIIVGIYNVAQLRVRLLDERFEIAGFVGKTLLCGKDVPGDFLNHKAAYNLKALVGGDHLNAEQKNVKHRFDVVGDFNVIITSNSRLHVKLDSDSGAWRRRLLIIDYEQPPTAKPIPYFARELVETEGPGILNWCIQGAVRLLRELKEHGAMQLSEAQIKRVDALLCESDSVRYFVSECVEKSEEADVTVSELATAYNNFCDEQGWQAVTVRQFENQLGDMMMEVHRLAKRTDIKRHDKNQRGFVHATLKKGILQIS